MYNRFYIYEHYDEKCSLRDKNRKYSTMYTVWRTEYIIGHLSRPGGIFIHNFFLMWITLWIKCDSVCINRRLSTTFSTKLCISPKSVYKCSGYSPQICLENKISKFCVKFICEGLAIENKNSSFKGNKKARSLASSYYMRGDA